MNSFATAILVSTAALSAAGQDVRFETGVTNIHVDLSVLQKGQSVHEMKPGDFVVRDEGQVQPILAFQEATVPLDLVLLVDAAFTMAGQKNTKNSPKMIVAALEAIKQMRNRDRTALISYGTDPRLDQELTPDSKQIAAALERPRIAAFGGPRRFLAIQWALWLLQADMKSRPENTPERKRAILMLATNEVMSWYPDEPLIQGLWGTDIALNIIRIPEPENRPVAISFGRSVFYRIDNVEHIAQATGGGVFTDPEKTFPNVLAEIQSSYSLWYRAPQAKPGDLRHITVELSDDAKKKYPGAAIRAREGYIAH
ncbi:MAG: VWA domain-containing protein [Bryobacteraceae bacterium]